jgi:hypothetical protein
MRDFRKYAKKKVEDVKTAFLYQTLFTLQGMLKWKGILANELYHY